MMGWEDCLRKRVAKSVKEDISLITSLAKSSKNRIESAEKLKLDEGTAASKVSLVYDSLREILEALAIKKGYKIYNHECYASFLKEVLKEESKGDEFDEIRKIRNAINYYGKEISPEDARDIMERIKELRIFLNKKYF